MILLLPTRRTLSHLVLLQNPNIYSSQTCNGDFSLSHLQYFFSLTGRAPPAYHTPQPHHATSFVWWISTNAQLTQTPTPLDGIPMHSLTELCTCINIHTLELFDSVLRMISLKSQIKEEIKWLRYKSRGGTHDTVAIHYKLIIN